MAVNINRLKTDMRAVETIYNRFASNFYDNKTDEVYYRDYAKMERLVEDFVKKIVDARTKIRRQLQLSGVKIYNAKRSKDASKLRAAEAENKKFIDEERIIEKMIDKIEQIRVDVWLAKTK